MSMNRDGTNERTENPKVPNFGWIVGLSIIFIAAVSFHCDGCGDDPEQSETICDNGFDDDSDLLVDCDDDDCAGTAACDPVADGDADVDVDGDADGDDDMDLPDDGDVEEEEDADVESGPECTRDCSDQPLRSRCEVGDCTEAVEDVDCCVAEEAVCSTVLTVGDLYEDLEVDWRGLFHNDHMCEMRLIESAGALIGMLEIQTRGIACEFGFIRVQLRLTIGEFETGEAYDLCSDEPMPGMQIVVNTNTGEGIDEQRNFYNIAGDGEDGLHCESPGTITVTEMGDATGDGYAVEFSGRLMTIDRSGNFAGETLDIDVSSAGLVTVQ